MDGIVFSRSPDSNTVLFYKPRNKQFYKADLFRISPHRLSGSIYSNIMYGDGLFCPLYRDNNPGQDKEFLLVTRVKQPHPGTPVLHSGKVIY